MNQDEISIWGRRRIVIDSDYASRFTFYVLLTLYVLWFSGDVQAQGLNASAQPDILREVGIDQRLNEQVPLDLVFRDETGKLVRLGDYFGEKPVILSLVYYECPMLCTLVLNGLLKSLRALSFDVGKEFNVVTVSFNPGETPTLAAAKKAEYIQHYSRPGTAEGWHFLTGQEASIQQLAQAVGFRYVYDAQKNQFAHASGIMVLTPQGRLSHYFYGIEYSPRDIRLSLVEASANKIGSPVDQLLLYCYHYDPTTGKYGVIIMNIIRLAGLGTVLALGPPTHLTAFGSRGFGWEITSLNRY
ncbi:SCO family protein [Candidatus Poribacteria bacterium]|nr:SCO family protein [Candidatus Poribacteria bacterium]